MLLLYACLSSLSAIITVELKEMISAITPVDQKGSIKTQYIIHHVHTAVGSWSSTQVCSVGFSKAF